MPSNAYLLNAASQRLFDIFRTHAILSVCIVFSQQRLHFISPIASFFLVNVNLICLAERSWVVQARTMCLWHPAVQLCFCVTRMLQGLAVILAAVAWVKILWLCVEGRGVCW